MIKNNITSNNSNSKLKILSIHWGFSLGGVGQYALLIDDVKKYAPIKINTLCILGQNWQYDKKSLQAINANIITIKSKFDFTWIKKALEKIKTSNPDYIMTHGFNGHFIAFLSKLLIHHKVPMICSYHGLYHATTPIRKILEPVFNKFTEHYLRKTAYGIISVAEYSKNYLISKNIEQKKITIVHNGINPVVTHLRTKKQLREEWGIKEDEILLGVASRLDPVKGISYLIEALAKLKKVNQKYKLVIIGTGTCDTILKKMVIENNLSKKIIFTGYRNDVKECLRAFDIFVLPSLAEYHSIALLEAMRAGKAIISTNVGGNTESVRHEKEGRIIPPANSEMLANAINRYIDNKDLRNSLGAAAKKRFNEKFTEEIMVKKTAKWFMDCDKQRTLLKN